jgi:hypothetical protein
MDQLRPNLRPPWHREKIIESYRFALLARVAVQVVARSRKFPLLASDGFYWREFAGTDARTAASNISTQNIFLCNSTLPCGKRSE